MRWAPIFQLRYPAGGIEHVERVVGDAFDEKAETALALEQVPLLTTCLIHQSYPDPNERSNAAFCSSVAGTFFKPGERGF